MPRTGGCRCAACPVCARATAARSGPGCGWKSRAACLHGGCESAGSGAAAPYLRRVDKAMREVDAHDLCEGARQLKRGPAHCAAHIQGQGRAALSCGARHARPRGTRRFRGMRAHPPARALGCVPEHSTECTKRTRRLRRWCTAHPTSAHTCEVGGGLAEALAQQRAARSEVQGGLRGRVRCGLWMCVVVAPRDQHCCGRASVSVIGGVKRRQARMQARPRPAPPWAPGGRA